MNWKNLNPISNNFYYQATDKSDLRLCQFIKKPESYITANTPVLLSYPDDEGIALNGGRTGSALAADCIRKYLYKMTWPFLDQANDVFLYDLGSLNTSIELKQRHESARKIVNQLLTQHTVYTIGGGHDYGYSDGAAFIDAFLGEPYPPLILNLDAHLDVRPTAWGLNSGTPFFRLLSEFKAKFQFIELGLQKQCNCATYWQWAKEQGALLYSIEEMRQIGILPLLKSLLQGSSKKQKCFISLDIDVFAQYLATGCSQSWGSGLTYTEVIEIIQWLLENKDVRLFSIYEVSPPLDFDNSTSKLAANLLHYVMTKNRPL